VWRNGAGTLSLTESSAQSAPPERLEKYMLSSDLLALLPSGSFSFDGGSGETPLFEFLNTLSSSFSGV
jgi:hypothetical protein